MNSAVWSIAQKNIRIHLTCSQGKLSKEWQEELVRYGRLVDESNNSKWDLYLEVEVRHNWSNLIQRGEVAFTPFKNGTAVHLDRIDLKGTLQDKDGAYEGAFLIDGRQMEALVVVVRSCLALLCEDGGEVFLHASGVRRNDALWLFYGPSGAGKSTIAQELNDGGEPFASDRVVLQRQGDGRIFALSTPFSDHTRVIGSPLPGPVAGVVYIEQGDCNHLEALSAHQALKAMFSESMIFTRRQHVFDNMMAIMGDLVSQNKCYKLTFTKDTSFWALLDNLEQPGNTERE